VRRIITWMCLCALSVTAEAAQVQGLYQVSVTVADQTQESRDEAILAAYNTMLIRLSGNDSVLDNPALTKDATSAGALISSLRYERTDNDELALVVEFMAPPMQALIRQSGEPLWGDSRPLTQLWLAVSGEQGREVVGPENLEWQSSVLSAMQKRGLPVLLPTWDLDDQMALPVVSLWGLFEEDIAAAAARYSSDGYLAGRIAQVRGQWRFTGYTRYGDVQSNIMLSHEDPQALLDSVAANVAEQLSARYAIVAQNQSAEGEIIRVSGVSSFQQYRALLDYCEAQAAITHTEVLGARQDEVTLRLSLSGDWLQIRDALALDQALVATDDTHVFVWGR